MERNGMAGGKTFIRGLMEQRVPIHIVLKEMTTIFIGSDEVLDMFWHDIRYFCSLEKNSPYHIALFNLLDKVMNGKTVNEYYKYNENIDSIDSIDSVFNDMNLNGLDSYYKNSQNINDTFNDMNLDEPFDDLYEGGKPCMDIDI